MPRHRIKWPGQSRQVALANLFEGRFAAQHQPDLAAVAPYHSSCGKKAGVIGKKPDELWDSHVLDEFDPGTALATIPDEAFD